MDSKGKQSEYFKKYYESNKDKFREYNNVQNSNLSVCFHCDKLVRDKYMSRHLATKKHIKNVEEAKKVKPEPDTQLTQEQIQKNVNDFIKLLTRGLSGNLNIMK